MKIFLDGAGKAAVKRMIPTWENSGHKIVNNVKQANVQLSSASIKTRAGVPTVLRLDGIYYDKGTNYQRRNKAISESHKQANAIIYQSDTSRRMCEKYLGGRQTKVYRVIHNGINPDGWNKPKEHKGINIFCCAKWRRPKRLEETIEVFAKFLGYYPLAQLHVVGWFKKGGKIIPHRNTVYYDKVDYEQMRKLYQIGDMFIHLCKRDSCPSAVVEAMAAGMPIITTNACGGATEMASLSPKCAVIPGESESLEADYIYQDACHKMPWGVQERMVKAMTRIAEGKPRIKLPSELKIEATAKKYLKVMKEIAR